MFSILRVAQDVETEPVDFLRKANSLSKLFEFGSNTRSRRILGGIVRKPTECDSQMRSSSMIIEYGD
jgi:hypothetical protein